MYKRKISFYLYKCIVEIILKRFPSVYAQQPTLPFVYNTLLLWSMNKILIAFVWVSDFNYFILIIY